MRKYAKYIYIISIVIVLGITVGFAAFVSEMSISNIVAEVRAKADIRITDVTLVPDQTNNVVSNDLNYSVDSIVANATFNDASSYITYKVTVTNIGGVEMGVLEVTGLNENLSYELIDYKLKDKICDSNNKCSLGITKEFYIKIFPTANTPITHGMKIKFNFQHFNTITYEDIKNNNYPTEIINGDNLSVTFTGDIPRAVNIYLNNAKVDSSLYTYSNNTLTYNNVTGNLKITGPITLVSMMKNGAVSDSSVNFGSTTGLSTINNTAYIRNGTQNDTNPIYYYRGNVTKNNVLFANFCWKIVRTTETGGTKLIYNGVPAADGSCNNTGTASQLASTSAFNSYYTSPADVGYMYGTRYTYDYKNLSSQSGNYLYGNKVSWDGTNYTLQDTYSSSSWSSDRTTLATKYHYTCFNSTGKCASVYYIHYFGNSSTPYYLILTGGKNIENAKTEMFTNTTNSTIKTAIDTWYASNMTSYTSKLENTIWCNDRSFYSGSLAGENVNAGTNDSYFGGYGRVGTSPYTPNLTCPNQNDSFTLKVANGGTNGYGNNALIYPVGLLTADELTLAGNGWNVYSTSSYLYTGQYWWSLSPCTFYSTSALGSLVFSSGFLNSNRVNGTFGVRPSVSLLPGTQIAGGEGTVSNPYTVYVPPKPTFVEMMSKDAVSDSSVNFGSTTGLSTINNTAYIRNGTQNDTNPIYYYRGNVTKNNVLFADFCWKIVRTTETGGTKLIYNGVPAADGSCNNTGEASQISTSAFNSSCTSPADVGYMYGTRYTYDYKNLSSQSGNYLYGNKVSWDGTNYTLQDTYSSSSWSSDRTTLATKYHYTCFNSTGKCASVYYIHYFADSSTPYYLTFSNEKTLETAKDEMFTNTTNSTIKTAIDTWYALNMASYTSKLENTIWCNDRSISYGPLKSKDEDSSSKTYTFFGGYGRVGTSPYTPNLTCPNQNDSFTLKVANGGINGYGNNALIYPVGLLTADELTLAGNGWNGYSTSSYLYTGQYWWSLSPWYFISTYAYGFRVYSSGYLNYYTVNGTFGVRPSVSLLPGTQIAGGEGTVSSPYTVLG